MWPDWLRVHCRPLTRNMSFVPYSRYSRASQRPRHYAIVMIAKNGKSNDSSLTESLCAIATDTVVVLVQTTKLPSPGPRLTQFISTTGPELHTHQMS